MDPGKLVSQRKQEAIGRLCDQIFAFSDQHPELRAATLTQLKDALKALKKLEDQHRRSAVGRGVAQPVPAYRREGVRRAVKKQQPNQDESGMEKRLAAQQKQIEEQGRLLRVLATASSQNRKPSPPEQPPKRAFPSMPTGDEQEPPQTPHPFTPRPQQIAFKDKMRSNPSGNDTSVAFVNHSPLPGSSPQRSGQRPAYMTALSSLHGAPSDEEMRQKEEQKRVLREEWDRQIREKKERELAAKQQPQRRIQRHNLVPVDTYSPNTETAMTPGSPQPRPSPDADHARFKGTNVGPERQAELEERRRKAYEIKEALRMQIQEKEQKKREQVFRDRADEEQFQRSQEISRIQEELSLNRVSVLPGSNEEEHLRQSWQKRKQVEDMEASWAAAIEEKQHREDLLRQAEEHAEMRDNLRLERQIADERREIEREYLDGEVVHRAASPELMGVPARAHRSSTRGSRGSGGMPFAPVVHKRRANAQASYDYM